MRRFGYFVTESSEHNAEYTPYFLKDDVLIERYDLPVEVRLPKPGRDLLTCKEYDSTLMLDPLEVAVLREIARG